jgi:nicotinate-nucleotide adenylyltransferase
MSTESRRLGLLGGTFDPVHYGHLDAAEAARAALALDEIWLLPTHVPPHRARDPWATPFQRFALIALAIADRPAYRVSDIELQRSGRTYTVDTLLDLHRQGWAPSQIFFILGTDAFAEIATWHHYPSVLDAANFVVIARPGTTIEAAVARNPELRSRVCAIPYTPSDGRSTRIILVPAHTRDVSSTTIRQRLSASASIDDLVPPPVGRHILTHHLYGAVDDLHGEIKSSVD